MKKLILFALLIAATTLSAQEKSKFSRKEKTEESTNQDVARTDVREEPATVRNLGTKGRTRQIPTIKTSKKDTGDDSREMGDSQEKTTRVQYTI